MKRVLLVIFLAIAVLSALCGCGLSSAEEPSTNATTQTTETTAPEEGELLVGYARVDITPKITTPLRGFGDSSVRMSNRVLEPLFISCVAVTGENGKTILLMAVDNEMSDFANKVIPGISKKTGVPEENIFINASHTHAAPAMNNSSEAFYISYVRELKTLSADVAVLALQDRAPAEMSYGSVETESLTFTRHYTYYSTTGNNLSYAFGGVDGIANSGMAEHLTEADETMHVLRFAREEAKDIVMTNWRAHPLLQSGEYRLDLSADFVGAFRTAVELSEDCNFIYFQGAAGNMNSITAIPSEIRTEDNNEYGAILAAYVSDCLANNMQKAEGSEIKIIGSDNTEEELPELHAFSIGQSVAFVTAPNELFDSTSVYMEENSPYPMNFTLGYTNGGEGYVPTTLFYNYLPAYTWYEVGITPYPRGTAEKIQEEYVKMLEKLSTTEAEQNTESELTLSPVESKQVAADLYWNVYRWDYTPGGMLDHSSRMKEDDGCYHVVFAANGQQETLLVKDKSLIEIIDFNAINGLTVDAHGVVTDVKVLRECTNGLAANRAIVTGVDGNTVSCTTGAIGGVPFALTLTDKTGIYDVSTADETCGGETTLREGDQILAIEDLEGAVSHVYVIRRAYIDDLTHTDHCVCGGTAEGLHGVCAPITDWIAWGDDPAEWDTLPSQSGHYYLTRDVVLPKRHKILADQDVTICLNGKQVTAEQSRLVAVLGTLSICDCRFVYENGTYTFEGKLSSGFADNSAGGVIYMCQKSKLNLYGGNVTGRCSATNGGLLYTTINSVTHIYNAVLNGGVAQQAGGAVYINNGEVYIHGGVITGGNAATKAGGLYMKSGTLTISGSPKITGNLRSDLWLGSGWKITIGEGGLNPGAEIGIMLDSGAGVFATNATKEDAKYFAAANGGKISWNSETGELSVNMPAG